MYTQQDYIKARSQMRRSLWVLIAYSAVMLAAVVVLAGMRAQAWTVFVSFLWLFPGLLFFSFKIDPILKYLKYLREARTNLNRTAAMELLRVEDEVVVRDGVEVYPVWFKFGKYERMLYWDANLGKPDWPIGRVITVTSTSYFILDAQFNP